LFTRSWPFFLMPFIVMSNEKQQIQQNTNTNTIFHISLLHDIIWLITLKLLRYVMTKLNHIDNNGGNA